MQRSAFTLLELAIAMIILGLLTATVLVGKELRKGAQIRSTIKEVEEINIALSNFYEAFQALPGDMSNASSYWPDNCPTNCDGDDDKIIEAYNEALLSWFHLTAANLLKGDYSGVGDGDTSTHTAHVNAPKSTFQAGQYALLHYHQEHFPDQHMIILGGPKNTDIGLLAILDPNSAYNLDSKTDDGLPSSGKTYGRNGWNVDWDSTNCLIDENGAREANSETIDKNIEYNMDLNTNECIMGFKLISHIGYDDSRTETD